MVWGSSKCFVQIKLFLFLPLIRQMLLLFPFSTWGNRSTQKLSCSIVEAGFQPRLSPWRSAAPPQLKIIKTKEVKRKGGLPWWSVVKTLHFRCKGHGFDPWSGKQDPACCMMGAKKKGVGGKNGNSTKNILDLGMEWSSPTTSCSQWGNWDLERDRSCLRSGKWWSWHSILEKVVRGLGQERDRVTPGR